MKRSEYMDNYGGDEAGAKLHRAYYAQFVTSEVRNLVSRCIGDDKVKASKDPHFNDIPLAKWDRIIDHHHVAASVNTAMREMGDYPTAAGCVCVLKEAAQQIRDGARFEVRSDGRLEAAFYTEHDANEYAVELRGIHAPNVEVMRVD